MGACTTPLMRPSVAAAEWVARGLNDVESEEEENLEYGAEEEEKLEEGVN